MFNYSEAWKIDRNSKISYTEQLTRNIRWSIFTGEVRWTEKLPPIRVLAETLGLGINTVRNAIKRLEEQELVVTKPHCGTIVLMESLDKRRLEEELVTSIKNALCYRMSAEEIHKIVDKVLSEAKMVKQKYAIFVSKDPALGHRFARQIAEAADINIKEVLLRDLNEYLDEHRHEIERLDAIITTYFDYSAVRSIARSYQPIIYGMTVELSPRVISALTVMPTGSTVTAVCRKDESAEGFANMVRRISPGLNVEIRHASEPGPWVETLGHSAAVFVSPTLSDKFRQADYTVPVYEMWDKINEQSLMMLKNHLYA